MSTPAGAGPSRRALARQARQQAVDLAREEGARIDEEVHRLAPALGALRDRGRARSRESARVRALALEMLPHPEYLAHCAEQLRTHLGAGWTRRAWPARVRAEAAELTASFERVVEMTTLIDLAGELEVSFDLVVVTQTATRAALSALGRLQDALDEVQATHVEAVAAAADPTRPAASARWLVDLAGRVLPAASRQRYIEEFSAELRELTEDGTGRGGQLRYSLRLVSRAWALRAALPARPEPTTGRMQVRSTARAHGAVDPAGLRLPLRHRTVLGRWLGRWESRWLARRGIRMINQRWARQERARRTDPGTAPRVRRRHRPPRPAGEGPPREPPRPGKFPVP